MNVLQKCLLYNLSYQTIITDKLRIFYEKRPALELFADICSTYVVLCFGPFSRSSRGVSNFATVTKVSTKLKNISPNKTCYVVHIPKNKNKNYIYSNDIALLSRSKSVLPHYPILNLPFKNEICK